MGILGVIIGILAIVCAFIATLLFGTAGGVAAGVLGAAAIVLGFVKRRKDGKGGIASVIIGVLAVIMAFALTGIWSNAFRALHEKALGDKPDGLWAQATENTSSGLMGIINNLPTDEAGINELIEEMNELNKMD